MNATARTTTDDLALMVVRGLNHRTATHDEMIAARGALVVLGAELDDESPLTPVFVPRSIGPARLAPHCAAGVSEDRNDATTERRVDPREWGAT